MTLPARYFDTPIGRNLSAHQRPPIIEVPRSLTRQEAHELALQFERAQGIKPTILDSGMTVTRRD